MVRWAFPRFPILPPAAPGRAPRPKPAAFGRPNCVSAARRMADPLFSQRTLRTPREKGSAVFFQISDWFLQPSAGTRSRSIGTLQPHLLQTSDFRLRPGFFTSRNTSCTSCRSRRGTDRCVLPSLSAAQGPPARCPPLDRTLAPPARVSRAAPTPSAWLRAAA